MGVRLGEALVTVGELRSQVSSLRSELERSRDLRSASSQVAAREQADAHAAREALRATEQALAEKTSQSNRNSVLSSYLHPSSSVPG